jgi:hypothetical protein
LDAAAVGAGGRGAGSAGAAIYSRAAENPARDARIAASPIARRPRMRPDLTLVLADSEVRAVHADAAGLRVRFAAANVRRDGVAGWQAGVTLALPGARCAGDPAAAFGRLAEGRLRVDGLESRTLAVPARVAGAVALSLHFANGAALDIAADGLACDVAADGAFKEDFSC